MGIALSELTELGSRVRAARIYDPRGSDRGRLRRRRLAELDEQREGRVWGVDGRRHPGGGRCRSLPERPDHSRRTHRL